MLAAAGTGVAAAPTAATAVAAVAAHNAAAAAALAAAEPWTPTEREDYILLSEFAQHVGPVPLLTLPESALEAPGINLSAFVLRIMAVDPQTRGEYGMLRAPMAVLWGVLTCLGAQSEAVVPMHAQ
jgi:hypothetical protein